MVAGLAVVPAGAFATTSTAASPAESAATGAVPNHNWGYGKLNIRGIIDRMEGGIRRW